MKLEMLMQWGNSWDVGEASEVAGEAGNKVLSGEKTETHRLT